MVKKVLIADDSAAFRNLEGTILAPYHYQLLHAENGVQCMKLAMEEKPDLILLDVQMPYMDGVQVLAFLQQHDSTRSIPIVFVTTLGREKDKELLGRGGARALISKPINALELVKTVRHILGE
ncbi:MAG: response regulator [Deltaproteobacteria bacterium]|nr:response regulator [Deltaproteobacteria bacterium]